MARCSRCGSYRKGACYSEEYIGIQRVVNKLERMTAFEYKRVWYFVVNKAIYIIQLHKTIYISLKTVRGAQLPIVGSLLTLT